MVAISLYRGNLHRAPDIPRRWLMPTPKISLKDFKSLLHRRNKALSRLRSPSSSSDPNPNPNPNPNPVPLLSKPPIPSPHPNGPPVEPKVQPQPPQDLQTGPPPAEIKVEAVGGSAADDCSIKPEDEQRYKDDNLPVDEKASEETGANLEVSEKVNELNGTDKRKREVEDKLQVLNAKKHNLVQVLKTILNTGEGLPVDEKASEETGANLEVSEKVNELNGTDKRKREVEDKLQVLNAKKHKLVQVLKTILNTEEGLKRRSSTQGMAMRPALPLQVETTNDSVSMTRLATPRMGSEANVAGENEGGEADDVWNHNIHSRHVFRMSSTSPSSESPLRRSTYIQHNVVPHPARASMGVTGSPSRFAPIGNQGHPGNPPTVSVSGTNYVASSPSPVASGGTSVFREGRQPSPWN